MIKIINKKEQTVEKVYPIRSKRKTKEGYEYIYTNYQVYIKYEYLKAFNITEHIYLYMENNGIYATSVHPDGSVPMKKLSVHMQRGNTMKRKIKPRVVDNKWKRFFILPKMFFPNTSENSQVLYTYDPRGFERFSGTNASLKIELI